METNEIISFGKSVLQLESAELIRTADGLDDSFAKAVKVVLSSEGKVIVSGLGKSGHIGRKIAATLSSTGTPSFFLHPGEALHGDLGVLEARDVLIAIAYGGETSETIEVTRFARRNGLNIIVLTGKPQSTLAQLGDIVLDGSIYREACPLQLAPTSSTTVAIALGDALAATIMQCRGFSNQDFAQFHPGGSIGRRLSLVQDHLKKNLLTLQQEDDFARVLELITSHNLGIAAVINENNQPIGAITDGDLRRGIIRMRDEVFLARANDLMSYGPKTIVVTALAVEAVKLMENHSISSLFVVDDKGILLGLVRMYDLLAAKIV